MHRMNDSALRYFFSRFGANTALRPLGERLEAAKAGVQDEGSVDALLEIYEAAIPILEREMWAEGPGREIISSYQALFREMEQLISIRGGDDRHDFTVVIPVADRPQQLKSCLDSLVELCRRYHYGGYVNGRFPKVSALIADDSREEANRVRNRETAESISEQGVQVRYLGLDGQWERVEAIGQRQQLWRVLGDKGRAAFYHKGPSVMRNIAYLQLRELAADKAKPLFFFVDSDQEFKIELDLGAGAVEAAALNYFYQLDRIFTRSPTQVLTGKVVGDPPVSPAVMAGNFLGDLASFLQDMAGLESEQSCRFHQLERRRDDDAAYHDMADLFGFQRTKAAYRYHCPLPGEHDHGACLQGFAAGLKRFFYGEHPTRKTWFSYGCGSDGLQPARTIYTGNYVLGPQALSYFIPFANLRLRMAGPVLGRIIKSELGGRFVSANLPLLHRRTVQETGQSEFRPGVESSEDVIDLSGEFERQFFGDVMLFSIESLTERGYPQRLFPREVVEETVHATRERMHRHYLEKHRELVERLKALRALVGRPEQWWNRRSGMEAARRDMEYFLDNMERNFGAGASGYGLVGEGENRRRRTGEIVDAIMAYPDDRRAWEALLSGSGEGRERY